MNDEQYINITIEISKNSKYPYGAIVVKDDEIIGRSDDNTIISKTMYSHAELMAIESACKNNKNLYYLHLNLYELVLKDNYSYQDTIFHLL